MEVFIVGEFKASQEAVMCYDDIMALASHPETKILDKPCPFCGCPRLLDASHAVMVKSA